MFPGDVSPSDSRQGGKEFFRNFKKRFFSGTFDHNHFQFWIQAHICWKLSRFERKKRCDKMSGTSLSWADSFGLSKTRLGMRIHVNLLWACSVLRWALQSNLSGVLFSELLRLMLCSPPFYEPVRDFQPQRHSAKFAGPSRWWEAKWAPWNPVNLTFGVAARLGNLLL